MQALSPGRWGVSGNPRYATGQFLLKVGGGGVHF